MHNWHVIIVKCDTAPSHRALRNSALLRCRAFTVRGSNLMGSEVGLTITPTAYSEGQQPNRDGTQTSRPGRRRRLAFRV